MATPGSDFLYHAALELDVQDAFEKFSQFEGRLDDFASGEIVKQLRVEAKVTPTIAQTASERAREVLQQRRSSTGLLEGTQGLAHDALRLSKHAGSVASAASKAAGEVEGLASSFRDLSPAIATIMRSLAVSDPTTLMNQYAGWETDEKKAATDLKRSQAMYNDAATVMERLRAFEADYNQFAKTLKSKKGPDWESFKSDWEAWVGTQSDSPFNQPETLDTITRAINGPNFQHNVTQDAFEAARSEVKQYLDASSSGMTQAKQRAGAIQQHRAMLDHLLSNVAILGDQIASLPPESVTQSQGVPPAQPVQPAVAEKVAQDAADLTAGEQKAIGALDNVRRQFIDNLFELTSSYEEALARVPQGRKDADKIINKREAAERGLLKWFQEATQAGLIPPTAFQNFHEALGGQTSESGRARVYNDLARQILYGDKQQPSDTSGQAPPVVAEQVAKEEAAAITSLEERRKQLIAKLESLRDLALLIKERPNPKSRKNLAEAAAHVTADLADAVSSGFMDPRHITSITKGAKLPPEDFANVIQGIIKGIRDSATPRAPARPTPTEPPPQQPAVAEQAAAIAERDAKAEDEAAKANGKKAKSAKEAAKANELAAAAADKETKAVERRERILDPRRALQSGTTYVAGRYGMVGHNVNAEAVYEAIAAETARRAAVTAHAHTLAANIRSGPQGQVDEWVASALAQVERERLAPPYRPAPRKTVVTPLGLPFPHGGLHVEFMPLWEPFTPLSQAPPNPRRALPPGARFIAGPYGHVGSPAEAAAVAEATAAERKRRDIEKSKINVTQEYWQTVERDTQATKEATAATKDAVAVEQHLADERKRGVQASTGDGTKGGGGGGKKPRKPTKTGDGGEEPESDKPEQPLPYSQLSTWGKFQRRLGYLGIFASAASIVFTIVSYLRQATREAIEFEAILANIQAVLPGRTLAARLTIGEAVIESAKRYGAAVTEAGRAAQFFAQAGVTQASEIATYMDAVVKAVRGASLAAEDAQNMILAVRAITDNEVNAVAMLDRISRVEARRAVTAKDMVDALTRVGPIARQLRGDMVGLVDEFDMLMGATTGIVERTRVSGTNAATTLRFIMARLGSPEIIRRLETVGSVRLARDPEGKTLRPAPEILHEISIAYHRLKEAGETVRATQLLVALGGARQLSGTTALLDSYRDTVLETARMSSMAFGDMTDRTAIAMDTVLAKLAQLKASVVSLGKELLENPLVRGALGLAWLVLAKGADLLAWTFDKIEHGIKRVAENWLGLQRLFGAQLNPYAFIPIGPKEIREAPQVKDFLKMTAEMGQEPIQYYERTRAIGLSMADELEQQLSKTQYKTLPAFLKALDEGKVEARTLRDEYGDKLVQAFKTLDPQLRQMTERFEQLPKSAEKAALKVEMFRRAYHLMGQTVYLANAVYEGNTEKLMDTVKVIMDEFTSQGLEAQEKVHGALGGSRWTIDYKGALETYVGSFDRHLRPAIRTIVDLADSLGIARTAWNDARNAGEDFGVMLDNIARQFEQLPDAQKLNLRLKIREQLRDIIGRKFDDKGEVNPLTQARGTGAYWVSWYQAEIHKAGEDIVRDWRANKPEEAERIQKWLDIVTHASAAPAFQTMLERMHTVRVTDDLAKLILEFWQAEEAADAFNQSLHRLGVNYDYHGERLQNITTFYKGILTFEHQQVAKILLMQQELARMQANASTAVGIENSEGLDFGEGPKPPSPEEIRQALKAVAEGRAVQLEKQVAFMKEQFTSFFGEGGVKFAELFGTDEHARRVLNDFFQSLNAAEEVAKKVGVDASELENAIANVVLSYRALSTYSAAEVDRRTDVIIAFERQKALLENEKEIEKARGQYMVQMAGMSGLIADRMKAEIEASRQMLILDRQAVIEDRNLSDKNERHELWKLDMAQRRFALEKRLTATAELQLKYHQQIQANIDQALSGVKSMFTEASGFLKGNKGARAHGLMGPLGSMILTRTFDNMMQFSKGNSGFARFLRGMSGYYETTIAEDLASVQPPDQTRTSATRPMYVIGKDGKLKQVGTTTEQAFVEQGMGRSYFDRQLTLMFGSLASTRMFGSGPNAAAFAPVFGQMGQMGGAKLGKMWGEALGSTMGTYLLPGIGTIAGTMAGAWIGSLFDKEDEEAKQTAALQRIDENTRETADVLELERRMLEVARGAVNVPAGFLLPQWTPIGSGGRAAGGLTIGNMQIQLNVPSGVNEERIVGLLRDRFGDMMQEELRSMGVL